ncbi:dTDP-4-dehydrorhamnose reductase [Pseudomonas sp. NPDC087598]|uniref:dTDP-4-dehydrorhamnose reductase n=1 Tax=Pseudomonas sp. NPDC087598 TaxID=3364440 RepID=UPI00380E9D81
MKVLLLGKNGQVGWELQRSLAPLGELIALGRGVSEGGLKGDLTDLGALRATIRHVKPDVIVNAAAYNGVDKAESDSDLAFLVNAQASKVMAEEAKSLDALLVHYSTDYVFSGQGVSPWREGDSAVPVNQYGLSKLEGERAIIASGCRHLIFRTSWVYSTWGNNFAKTMLRLARERESLSVIFDQVGAPTGSDLIADVTAHAILQVQKSPQLCGIYHLVAAGEVSWHGYASHVIEFARNRGETVMVKTVEPIESSAYPTPARRPLNSRLNTAKLRNNFSLHLPDWQSGVNRMLMEVFNK